MDNVERYEYYPSEGRCVTEAILLGIERHTDQDLRHVEFQLYDDIDPDALNRLFENDSSGIALQFDTDGVTVQLHGDCPVEIQIASRSDHKSF